MIDQWLRKIVREEIAASRRQWRVVDSTALNLVPRGAIEWLPVDAKVPRKGLMRFGR